MTLSALILLAQIRRVQRSEDGQVWIDEDNHSLTTVVDAGMFGMSKRNTINVKNKWDTIDSTAKYLQAEGLLEYEPFGYLHLNHKGYHYYQDVVLRFLLESIAVPIIVAFFTTLITLWLQGIFSPK